MSEAGIGKELDASARLRARTSSRNSPNDRSSPSRALAKAHLALYPAPRATVVVVHFNTSASDEDSVGT